MFTDYLNLLIVITGFAGILIYIRRIYLDLMDQDVNLLAHLVKVQDAIQERNRMDKVLCQALDGVRDAMESLATLDKATANLVQERLIDIQYITEKLQQDFTEFTAVETELADISEKPPETAVNPYWDEKRGVYSAAKYRENMEKQKNSGIVLETTPN